MNVFISYAQEDTPRIQPISDTLASWHVSFWAPPRTGGESAAMMTQVQQVLRQTDVFLRICSAATPRSYWMNFEQTAFLSLQADEFRQTMSTSHRLINIVIDAAYERLAFDYADPIIDVTKNAPSDWRASLHRMLFAMTAESA